MYEPSLAEIVLTNAMGNTLMHPYYMSFVKGLDIKPFDTVLDFCCGSGIISRKIARLLPEGHLVCADVSQKWLLNTQEKVLPYNASIKLLDNLLPRKLYKEKFRSQGSYYSVFSLRPIICFRLRWCLDYC